MAYTDLTREQKTRRNRWNAAAKKRYDKAHYKRLNFLVKPHEYARIEAYCEAREISKAEFLRIAVETLTDEISAEREADILDRGAQ